MLGVGAGLLGMVGWSALPLRQISQIQHLLAGTWSVQLLQINLMAWKSAWVGLQGLLAPLVGDVLRVLLIDPSRCHKPH